MKLPICNANDFINEGYSLYSFKRLNLYLGCFRVKQKIKCVRVVSNKNHKVVVGNVPTKPEAFKGSTNAGVVKYIKCCKF